MTRSGYKDIVELLILGLALNIDIRADNGYTALNIAETHGHIDIEKLLIATYIQ